MFDKLDFIEGHFNDLNQKVSDPEVIADTALWSKLCKELSDITPIVEKYKEYKRAKTDIEEAKEMLNDNLDKDFREMVAAELDDAKERLEETTEALKILLLPKDPNDEKNVIVEIRAGAGGDEAALFVAALYRMYSMYAESNRFKIELIDQNETGLGGFKEIVFQVVGNGAFSKLKFESGVHRVQRVPETESAGRIHTSTVTVAVLPEAEDVDVEINATDLRIDVYRASGAGGQHVNKTESAVRITHLPTGIVVACQSERSQHQNKDAAMKILRSKLYEEAERQKHQEMADERKSQVGTGDRSERIRTYNYPQGRVTDHRIGLTLHKLEQILNGDLTELIDSLTAADQSEKLKGNN
ncbi:MAG: peptide chain release factor 1 [Clostridia bacterium]|nr:peptide chain release factor 1 [Clostridia bacterium]